MSLGLTVVGTLGSTSAIGGADDALHDRRPIGDAVDLAVCGGRFGLDVQFVAAVDEEIDAELRAPLAAEGVELVCLDGATSNTGSELTPAWEEALRGSRRREGLIVTCDAPAPALDYALELAQGERTLSAVVLARPYAIDPRRLGTADVVVADLAAARALCGDGDDVGARGIARRIGAFGPKRVVLLDRTGRAGSVHFDGTDMRRIDFAKERADHGPRITVFAAVLVASLAGGEHAVRALAQATRCAGLADSGDWPFAHLPSAPGLSGEPESD
ncbi:hypothetical protein Pla163_19180 [Planctomycetes bacterium Pla163]|uniref:Pyridoxal kinase n=1 Tax=Rohdeia mirabilis TaxID=2528008 RepID=A0A518D002_9BACT|nr:hypothetical protein Pla163_19180 [Planctomycetes bacterium Pla163]